MPRISSVGYISAPAFERSHAEGTAHRLFIPHQPLLLQQTHVGTHTHTSVTNMHIHLLHRGTDECPSVSCKAERENTSSVILVHSGLNKACSLLLFPSLCLPASVNVSFLIHHPLSFRQTRLPFLILCLFVLHPSPPSAVPPLFPTLWFPITPPSVSIHLWLPFPHRVCLVIIPSPSSPSSMKIESRPAHQFALTVNCVENSSGCRAPRPGQGFQTDRT